MNLIKIIILFLILQSPIVWAQQNTAKPQAPTNSSSINSGIPGATTNTNLGQDSNQQGTTKKDKTEQILIDPFSGSASTASIDVNTNPDLANFVDQTLVGLIVGETKKIAVLQSAQGQINRFKKNDKINSEYKILEIYKDKILVASLDNNEYEVYFNNVIKPVEKKKVPQKKPVKLDQQLENSLDPNADPLAPKVSPKKQASVKKISESKASTKKTKKPALDSSLPDSDAESNPIKEDGDLNKSEMEKVSNVDVEKIKDELKK